MSYMFEELCYDCYRKQEGCTDSDDIRNAIQTIHSKTNEQGHKGSGTIKLECFNRTPKAGIGG